jgi:hypothetical protein
MEQPAGRAIAQAEVVDNFAGPNPVVASATGPYGALWPKGIRRRSSTRSSPCDHVKGETTERHPAQGEVYYEDVPVGSWTTAKSSGALPAKRVDDLLERVEKPQHAMKFAREEGNGIEVTDQRAGCRFESGLEIHVPVVRWQNTRPDEA